MRLLLILGWRNIWRNKRRSFITISAVVFAVMLSIVMRGIQLGTYDVNIRYMVELFSGYLQIQKPGYKESPTLRKSFVVTDSLRQLLASNNDIVAYAPRVAGDGLISFRDNSQGAILFGIDPEAELRVSKFASRISAGHYLSQQRPGEIVLGQKLMENLKANIGDTVVILAQGLDGSLGNQKFTIVGTGKTGLGDFDRGLVLMNLADAQELLVMGKRINLVALRLNSLPQIGSVKQALEKPLTTRGLTPLAWNEVMPDFENAIKMDNITGILTLGILVVVVAFGIANTVLMSVTERFREFGIVLSIGMQQGRLVMVVFLETLMIVFVGLIVGNALAYGINSYLALHPIEFGGEFGEMYEEYGFLPRIESALRFSSFLNTTLSMLGISILAMIYPLTKILRLEPLKGIRYT